MNFTFHTDAGHGWLFASNAQLADLGLTRSSFSQYSYSGFDDVYAEEDCDAGIVINAVKAQGREFEFNERHIDGDHWIRSLERCHP
jgi:hypothetical protein